MGDIDKDIDLLAIGSPCADLVLAVQRLPAWDDKSAGRSLGTFSGGTEANVACALSRLGRRTACFGSVGDDANGRFLRRAFVEDGVGTDYLRVLADGTSASTVLFVSPTGERALVWVAPSAEPPRHDLDHALQRSRLAYVMPYELPALLALREAATRQQALVAIDVEREGARRAGDLRAMLNACDVAFFNQSGFTEAAGQAPGFESMRGWLAATACRLIVVTLGDQGALAVSVDEQAAHPAFAAEVVDVTGAGDSFNAAFLDAWLEGRGPLASQLAFACAAASRTVAAVGARTGMPGRAEVEALMDPGRSGR